MCFNWYCVISKDSVTFQKVFGWLSHERNNLLELEDVVNTLKKFLK